MNTIKRSYEGIKAEVTALKQIITTKKDTDFLKLDELIILTSKKTLDFFKKRYKAQASIKLQYIQDNESLYNNIKLNAPHLIDILLYNVVPVFMVRQLIENNNISFIQREADNRPILYYLYQVLLGEVEEYYTDPLFSEDNYNIIKNPKASKYNSINGECDLLAIDNEGNIIDYIEVQTIRKDKWKEDNSIYIKPHKVKKSKLYSNYKLYLYVYDIDKGTYEYIILKPEDLNNLGYKDDCYDYGGKPTYLLDNKGLQLNNLIE